MSSFVLKFRCCCYGRWNTLCFYDYNVCLGTISSPLGPFVPAPPEVAMQMLREQGGPSPFEGGGRNGRSGPQLSGPAPIIALPQAFRQDPRRLRRQVVEPMSPFY